MKIFILGLLLLQVQHTWAQQQAVLPVDDITKLITYTNKIDMPDKDKGKLYDKALEWCNAYYKNPTDVIRERMPQVA